MGEKENNNNLNRSPVTRLLRNTVLGATMADLPAMMTASGWRQNEKGDYVLDLQNDPHVKLLRDNLAAEGTGVMLGEFGLPALYGLYNLGIRSLGKAGNNWARAKLISREMNDIVGEGLQHFGKVKYYGPTMGKTTAAKTNPDLADFDDVTREAKNSLAKELNIPTRVLQSDPKYALAYLEMLERELNKWRRNPLNTNKTLVISKKGLADKNIYNNEPSIPDRQTFVQRLRNRGETDDANSNDWYNMLLKQNPNLRIDNRFISEIEYNPHYIEFQSSKLPYLKKGSGIHIKKKNRGKFTEYCGGEVTDECILKAKKSKNPKLRKRAIFALNSRRWKHEEGAKIHKPNGHKSILDNGWMKDRKIAKGSGGTFPGFWDDTVMYHPEIAEGNPIVAEINERNYIGEVKKLPYAQTVQFIRNLENPREKGISNGVARAYDSRTAGYGTDFVSGHPELAAKIKSGKWTALEAKDLAVTDMRNHDRVIMENLQQYTTRPDTISPGPRLLAALARYHYGNIRRDFDEWGRAIANGDAETQKKIALKLSKGYDDRNLKILEFDIYGL